MPGLHEVCGLELIERIAGEFFAKDNNASRVWSPSYGCWGFFEQQPTIRDKFVVVGCAKNGDLILPDKSMIWKPLNDGSWEPYHSISEMSLGLGMIFDKKIIEVGGVPSVALFFLLGGESPGVYNLIIKQHDAYDVMWNILG